MTHEKGTPWQIEAERNNYIVLIHHRIPDDIIKNYFRLEAKKLDPGFV